MVLGWFWDGFGMILGWFWDGFGMVLGWFWDGMVLNDVRTFVGLCFMDFQLVFNDF